MADLLDKAREEVARADYAQALQSLRQAGEGAIARGDHDEFRSVIELVEVVRSHADRGTRREVERLLASYLPVGGEHESALARERLAGEGRDLRGPRARQAVPLGVLSLLFASGASVAAFIHLVDVSLFCEDATKGIPSALALTFFGGIVVAVSLLLVRKRPTALTAALLVGAAALALAIGLVASDSATYRGVKCGLFDDDNDDSVSSAHFTYLYVLWGIPLAVLLLQAMLVWRESHRADAGGCADG